MGTHRSFVTTEASLASAITSVGVGNTLKSHKASLTLTFRVSNSITEELTLLLIESQQPRSKREALR